MKIKISILYVLIQIMLLHHHTAWGLAAQPGLVNQETRNVLQATMMHVQPFEIASAPKKTGLNSRQRAKLKDYIKQFYRFLVGLGLITLLSMTMLGMQVWVVGAMGIMLPYFVGAGVLFLAVIGSYIGGYVVLYRSAASHRALSKYVFWYDIFGLPLLVSGMLACFLIPMHPVLGIVFSGSVFVFAATIKGMQYMEKYMDNQANLGIWQRKVPWKKIAYTLAILIGVGLGGSLYLVWHIFWPITIASGALMSVFCVGMVWCYRKGGFKSQCLVLGGAVITMSVGLGVLMHFVWSLPLLLVFTLPWIPLGLVAHLLFTSQTVSLSATLLNFAWERHKNMNTLLVFQIKTTVLLGTLFCFLIVPLMVSIWFTVSILLLKFLFCIVPGVLVLAFICLYVYEGREAWWKWKRKKTQVENGNEYHSLPSDKSPSNEKGISPKDLKRMLSPFGNIDFGKHQISAWPAADQYSYITHTLVDVAKNNNKLGLSEDAIRGLLLAVAMRLPDAKAIQDLVDLYADKEIVSKVDENAWVKTLSELLAVQTTFWAKYTNLVRNIGSEQDIEAWGAVAVQEQDGTIMQKINVMGTELIAKGA